MPKDFPVSLFALKPVMLHQCSIAFFLEEYPQKLKPNLTAACHAWTELIVYMLVLKNLIPFEII